MKSNKILVIGVVLLISILYLINQGWFNLKNINQNTFVINIISPLSNGELYYGCKAPISKADCVYYGVEYYSHKYVNVVEEQCSEKEWGVECTFTGDKIL